MSLAVPPMTPEYRVRWLLRFPFSPAVRELTLKSLLSQPSTSRLVIEALNIGTTCPHCRASLTPEHAA